MKWISQMTLRELQQYRIVCTKEMRNRGGDVFAAGTAFEARNKRRGLTLRTIDLPHRWIKTLGYSGLTLVSVDGATADDRSAIKAQQRD